MSLLSEQLTTHSTTSDHLYNWSHLAMQLIFKLVVSMIDSGGIHNIAIKTNICLVTKSFVYDWFKATQFVHSLVTLVIQYVHVVLIFYNYLSIKVLVE